MEASTFTLAGIDCGSGSWNATKVYVAVAGWVIKSITIWSGAVFNVSDGKIEKTCAG